MSEPTRFFSPPGTGAMPNKTLRLEEGREKKKCVTEFLCLCLVKTDDRP